LALVDQPVVTQALVQSGESPGVGAGYATAAGVVVLLICLSSQAAWWSGIATTLSADARWPQMAPITALTLTLCSISLVCAGLDILLDATSPRLRFIARGAALIALFLAVVRFAAHQVGLDLHLDMLGLERSSAPPSVTLSHPMMSAPTALVLVFLGASLTLVYQPRWASASRTLAILALLASLIGFTRYLFGDTPFGVFNRMSIQTSISIQLLTTGVLALRARQGPLALLVSGGAAGVSMRQLLPAALIMPFIIGVVVFYAQRLGKLDNGQGYALVTIASVLIFAGLVWTSSARLERLDEERRKAQDALRTNEERMRQIVESASDAIITKDLQGIVTSWNAGAERTLGYTPGEMIGQPVTRIIPPSRLVEEEAILEILARGELIEHFETERLHKQGHIIAVSVTVSPIHDASGRVIGASKVARDITARKNSEELLRASNARFRLLAESLPQLIWTCNAQGRCNYMSRQWGEYTGRKMDEPLDGAWLDCVHPADRPILASAWVAAIKTHSDFNCEIRLRRTDGVYRWFSARATPHRDESGRVTQWYGATTDIEDQMHAQEAQLRSQKMEALGTLAGGIAHDFNNILSAISGNTGLALDELPSDHPVRSSLSEIERATRRAADLVRRILAFSREEKPRSETLYLQPVIEEAFKLLRPTLPAQIDLRAMFDADVPATVCDATQVHQILMNLSTNAAHAIGDRRGSIEIKLTTATILPDHITDVLRAGQYACLEVSDDGSGMDRKTMQRIFDPFFTTKQTGTGLGLSVVHGIMKAHRGAVTVYSEPARGTRFRLYFPAATDTPAKMVPSEATKPSRASGQRILYVDDDEALVMLTTRKLARLGYEVTGETDPRDALKLFSTNIAAFDAVVSDLSMPGMPGFELAREMLALRPDLPVIMTSGFVRPEDQKTAQQIGVRAMILKPGTNDELAKLLEQIFRESRGTTRAVAR
jgi:PAS domain S-box-containing protein